MTQALVDRVGGEDAVLRQRWRPPQRADPEVAVAILVERLRVAVLQPWRVGLVENRELHAVETDQAPFGAQPDVAVASLEDRLNRVLGEALIGLPHLVRVLRDDLVGIQPSAAGASRPRAGRTRGRARRRRRAAERLRGKRMHDFTSPATNEWALDAPDGGEELFPAKSGREADGLR